MLLKNIKPDSDFPGQLLAQVFCPFLSRDIDVYGCSNSNISYANECAQLLVELDEPSIEKLCQASIRYYTVCQEEIREPVEDFANERGILQLTKHGTLIVRDGYLKPVIHLEIGCEWEEEHGMEWIIRDGQVQYVGPFHGENPFSDFSLKPEWNYA